LVATAYLPRRGSSMVWRLVHILTWAPQRWGSRLLSCDLHLVLSSSFGAMAIAKAQRNNARDSRPGRRWARSVKGNAPPGLSSSRLVWLQLVVFGHATPLMAWVLGRLVLDLEL